MCSGVPSFDYNNFRQWDLLNEAYILEHRGQKFLCCLHPLLNEKINFSYKLAKIQIHGRREIYPWTPG